MGSPLTPKEVMRIAALIAEFIGRILKWVLPDILKQGRKAREVKSAGFDKELEDDINKTIEDQIK